MPFVSAPGIAKAEILWSWTGGKSIANVMHLDQVGGGGAAWTLADAQTIADAFFNALSTGGASLAGISSSALTLDAVVLTDLTSSSGVQARSTGSPVAGGNATEPLPSSATVLEKLVTAVRSRHGRGRVFCSGAAKAVLDSEGRLTSAAIAGYDGAWATVFSLLLAASPSCQFVILNRSDGSHIVVTGHSTEQLIRSQRRRELDH